MEDASLTPARVLRTARDAGPTFRPADIRAAMEVEPQSPRGMQLSVALGQAVDGLEKLGYIDWHVDPASGDKRWTVTDKGRQFLKQEDEQ